MTAWRWYWCPRCEVWGKGSQCWSCGNVGVVRHGPLVDVHVYGTLGDECESGPAPAA